MTPQKWDFKGQTRFRIDNVKPSIFDFDWFDWFLINQFFEPPKPYLALETSLLGGVILLKLFDLNYGFGATDGKIANFRHNQPWKSAKPWHGSKRFRSVTPQKRGFWGLKSGPRHSQISRSGPRQSGMSKIGS